MIGLKKFLKSKVIPYALLLLAALVFIYLWRTYSDTTKNQKYGEITVFDYEHRWYHAGDRFSFDRMAKGETYNFKKSVPFYFAAKGFQPQDHALDDNSLAYILKNARLQTPHAELSIHEYNLRIEEDRVRTRSKSTFGAFIEFLEDLAELDRGSLSFLSKKETGYQIIAEYTVSIDSILDEKPLLIYLELPGLKNYAKDHNLLPVIAPAFRSYEAYDGERIFLAHKNPYQTKAGLRFWAVFKYIFIVIIVILVVLLKIWSDDDEKEEDDDDVSVDKLAWSEEKWASHYENATEKALRDGDFKKALKKAEEAIQDKIQSEEIYINAITSAINLPDFEKAISLCREAEKLYPDSVYFYCLHGNAVLALTQNGEKAIPYFEKAREHDTEGYGSDTINIGLASCNAQLGKIKEAVENINLLSEEAFENPEIYKIAALIYSQAKMPDRLLETTTKWLEVAPHNKEAQSLHAQATEALAKTQKNNAPKIGFDQEKFDRIFNETLAESNPEKQVEKAMKLNNQGKPDEAMKILKTLPVDKITNPDTLNNMARMYSSFGLKQQAEEMFTKTIELSNKEIAALKYKAGKQSLNTENLIKLANIFSYAGYALYNTNQKSAALDNYINQNYTLAQINNADPDRQDILRALATSFGSIVTISKELGDTSKAASHAEEEIHTLKKLIDLNPEDIKLQAEIALKVNSLGKLYEAEGNNESALDCYEVAIDIKTELLGSQPERSDWARTLSVFHNNAGALHYKAGEMLKALEAFKMQNKILEELLAREPQRKDFLNDLANSFGWLSSVYKALDEKELSVAAGEKQKEALEKAKA